MTYCVLLAPHIDLRVTLSILRLTKRNYPSDNVKDVQRLMHKGTDRSYLFWHDDWTLNSDIEKGIKLENLRDLASHLRTVKDLSVKYFGTTSMSDEEFISEVIKVCL